MDRKFTPTTLLVLSGLLIWAADFLVIYIAGALVCANEAAHARVLGAPLVIVVTVIATAVASAATIVIARRARRLACAESADERVRFTLFLAAALCGLALVAIAWTAAPALLLRTACF